mmetsp:Transcript_17802/g.17188  ORF Transcript_17802/g.17188 Transcript_17802/m.17188 type:complete len:98 (+) Transcript_17802:58-351(+)|eukprot:CAMPEP_0197832568 /NCGR_PEP_ID=MMETSP1437-20131217/15277_1 /TAXON_ID=49252 ORGANISM="Eucampia antarctica, Strain CCMP1452" /NCGR_SAMPLE_ID=MMETSP1437 /ASSEMBLY_ACC=CAM_ASM_001096 /LENGTH=97 /DNA_ID=CAMNT_0043436001 /DNA_START=55 /DNA_END=348 /DNA_ORIENTATION=+
MVLSAFSRSRPLMARYDVSPHMVKWWKSNKNVNGEVTRHLSPFEQQAVVPWLRTFPKRAYDKFMDSGAYLIGTAIIVIGSAAAADEADAAEDRSHRF